MFNIICQVIEVWSFLISFKRPLLVCIYSVCVLIYVHMNEGQRWTFSTSIHVIILGQSLTERGVHQLVDWLAGDLQGSSCFYSLSPRGQMCICYHTCTVHSCWGSKPRSPSLHSSLFTLWVLSTLFLPKVCCLPVCLLETGSDSVAQA